MFGVTGNVWAIAQPVKIANPSIYKPPAARRPHPPVPAPAQAGVPPYKGGRRGTTGGNGLSA